MQNWKGIIWVREKEKNRAKRENVTKGSVKKEYERM
jgi:hypothetical protein